ncbi:hypothetical protein ACOACO_17345 [Nocardioides sp. CPCC 205120]|uniref:hypothetical protein n=1 Tax=Nocardioides sp. CPCC 205120 TaxID=3406462 RepID=UPI003B5142B4
MEIDKPKMIAALEAKGALGPCDRCNTNTWLMLEEYAALSFTDSSKAPEFNESIVPAVALVCQNCGYILLHSTHVLGV